MGVHRGRAGGPPGRRAVTATLSDLLDALEAVDLGEATGDPVRLAKALEARQSLIAQLEARLPVEGTPEERPRVVQRLSKVLERDRAAQATLRDTLRQLGTALDSLVSGRAAVRGYGASTLDTTASTRRLG